MTTLPCAIYTRKSSEEGLEQGFNSLDAQREACQAYIASQRSQGWKVGLAYEDGGFSGGNTDRPGLKKLLADVQAGRVKVIVVYKVDRLTRSLADFAKLVELFDAHGVSFVSVTQQFNTTTSMGRLTLNVLLSFAQFEREVTGERIRDKIAASKQKGMWMGGLPPMGYVPKDRTLVVDEPQADRVREIYRLYLELGAVRLLKAELDRRGWRTTQRGNGRANGGQAFSRGHLYTLLRNPIYIGQIGHKGKVYPGQHPAIVEEAIWQAVQKQLADNRNGDRVQSAAAHPSLLTGLLVDDQGRRLTPTHANKGSRRYRYYVGEALHAQGRQQVGAGLRLPATELEQAVVRGIVEFLRDERGLVAALGELPPEALRHRLNACQRAAESLGTPSNTERGQAVQRLLVQVVVHSYRLVLTLNLAACWEARSRHVVEIQFPVQLKRCGMAMRLILPSAGKAGAPPDPKLCGLIAKANQWFELLSSGQQPTVESIAQADGLTGSYVSRVVQLAFLAPQLQHRIFEGGQPPELSAKRLLGLVPLPPLWEDQERLLGMT